MDLIRRGYDLWNAKRADDWALIFHPEIEFRPSGAMPGLQRVYEGRDGVRRLMRDITEAIEDFHAEPIELVERGEFVGAVLRFEGKGRGSGVPVRYDVSPCLQLPRGARRPLGWRRDARRRFRSRRAAGVGDVARQRGSGLRVVLGRQTGTADAGGVTFDVPLAVLMITASRYAPGRTRPATRVFRAGRPRRSARPKAWTSGESTRRRSGARPSSRRSRAARHFATRPRATP